MALELMKLIFAVRDVSFNSGPYTVIIKRQFLYINIFSFSTIIISTLVLASLGQEGQNLRQSKKAFSLVT